MKMIFFKLTLILLTVIRAVFPFDFNISYNKLPITFEIESVSDIYAPADKNSTNVCEYPTVMRLSGRKASFCCYISGYCMVTGLRFAAASTVAQQTATVYAPSTEETGMGSFFRMASTNISISAAML